MVLAFASCSKEGEVREVYLPQQIGFVLYDAAGAVTEGMEMGVTATCRRDGNTVSLTEGRVAQYVARLSSGGRVALVPKSDADRIYACYGDAGLHYAVFSPYSETGFEEIRVPQHQIYGQQPARAVYGEAFAEQVTGTVTVPVAERPLCSILALEIPADLVAEKRVTLSELSVLGVTMDFGQGLTLEQPRTVQVAVAPFFVPSGGIPVGFRTKEGDSLSSTILSGAADAGLSAGVGETLAAYVPPADPFLPCEFPVVFPLGRNPSARTGYYNYSDDQPEWTNRGIWRCFAQKQVYATWNQVSEPSATLYQKRELVNTGEIGSIGLKGIWTGDYFEFVFPLGAVDAGSVITFKAPFYGRQQPVFWTVEWLDGSEWRRKVTQVEAWDGTRCEASFATRPYGCTVSYSFALEHPIRRGVLKVRLICSDGSLQADIQSNQVVKRDLPYNDGKIYQSPFYFYCEGAGEHAFVWTVAPGPKGPEPGMTEDLQIHEQDWEWED